MEIFEWLKDQMEVECVLLAMAVWYLFREYTRLVSYLHRGKKKPETERETNQ